MDRRNFFRQMIGGVAAAAAVRTFPFRVFSFPTDLRIVNPIVGQTNYFSGCSASYMAAIQALELETIAQEIPDLLLTENMLYEKLRRNNDFRFKWA